MVAAATAVATAHIAATTIGVGATHISVTTIGVGATHIAATTATVGAAYIATTAVTAAASVYTTNIATTAVGATHITAEVAGNHGDAQGQGTVAVGDGLHPLGFYGAVTTGVAASVCHKIGEPEFISAHSLRLQSKMS